MVMETSNLIHGVCFYKNGMVEADFTELQIGHGTTRSPNGFTSIRGVGCGRLHRASECARYKWMARWRPKRARQQQAKVPEREGEASWWSPQVELEAKMPVDRFKSFI